MRYQKEFEERFIDAYDDDFQGVNPKTGRYYDPEDQALYEGFVAGIESGIEKKEPTLLELVGEWRKSDISDEELLSKISEALILNKKLDNLEVYEIEFKPVTNRDFIRYRLVDLKYNNGNILERRVSASVNWSNTHLASWRPSAVQD